MIFIVSLIIFFLSVVIHEYCHGWTAYKLGDSTAKHSGRLTLNPLAHIDPIGTVLLPLLLFVTRAPFMFGWAKPVPVNYWNLHNPKRDMIWVGLSGPLANILIAALMSFIIRSGISLTSAAFLVLNTAAVINLVLAVFNLVPIPPLDGSRIISGLLPEYLSLRYNRLEQFGFIIVIILMRPLFNLVVLPIVELLARFLGI